MTLKTKEKSQRNVKLSPHAKAYWIQLHNEFEAKCGKEFQSIQAMACKAADQMARLAAILAYLDDSGLQLIPLAAVERAASLMDFYLNESLRLQEISEDDHRIKLAEKCLEWAFKEPDDKIVRRSDDESNTIQFHLQGFLQKGPNPLRTKVKAERILMFLHDYGLARKLPATKFGDKDRKEVWEIRRYEADEKIA
jgi:hypothetical protein